MGEWDIIQWVTILSPIIAVIIAWLTIHYSNKGTTKQLNAIKRLSILQAEIAIIQNEIECTKNRLLLLKAQENVEDFGLDNPHSYQMDSLGIMQQLRESKQYSLDLRYHSILQQDLQKKQQQLMNLKKELEQLK